MEFTIDTENYNKLLPCFSMKISILRTLKLLLEYIYIYIYHYNLTIDNNYTHNVL